MSTTTRALAGCLLTAALLGVVEHSSAQQREPARAEVRGTIKAVDVGARTITVAIGGGREVAASEETYALAKNVEVALGGGFRSVSTATQGKLGDLSAGTQVSLALTADKKTVESILAEEPTVRGVLKSVDVKKNTLTVAAQAQRDPAAEDKTYALAANAEIAIDDGRGRRFSIREGKLEELAEGAIVSLRLSLDKKQVHGVLAEGALITGVVKSLDAAKRSLTLVVRPARGDDAGEERTLSVAKEGVVLVDDGKGRRLSLKESKLADVPVGSLVAAKLSVDQSFVMMLRAEGPTVLGLLKAVDAKNRTITIAIPKGRDNPEEKTFTLAKDARITSEGNTANLADLKVGDNGPLIQLRLTLDQKTVQSVTARQPGAR